MKTLTLLFLLLTTLSLRAEPAANDGGRDIASSGLTLNEVTRAVLERNPAIREARRKWEAARQRVTQEVAWDDLKISAASRVRRYVEVAPDAFTDQLLSIEQAIPISGKNRVRARIAAAEAVAAFEEVRREELDALMKARSSYFRLANAYAQIEFNHRNHTSLTQIAEISRSRYQVGTQSAVDTILSETEAAKLLETRRDLERNVASAQSQLNVLMNRDAFAPLGIPGDVILSHTEFPIDKLRTLMLADRPEMRVARAKVDAEQARLQLAHRAWIPDPSLKVEGQRYNDAAQGVSELDAGISFSVPWENYRKYSAAVRETTANVSAAKAALEQTRNEAIGSLRDVLQKVETAHHHVELFRDKLVPQSRQALDAMQFAYESGKATFAEWIATQRSLRDMEAEAREHLADYQIALAELESVVGVDLNLFPSSNPKPEQE